MKKLMTTLSAVAVAFGLYASTPLDTGTSFEGIEIPLGGSSVALDIDSSTGELEPAGEGYSYWVTNENSTLTVMDCTGTGYGLDRPDQFAEADQNRYLNVKTTLGNPVTRKVDGAGEGADVGSGGYYFDSLVKFTAFDSDPTSLFDSDNGRTVITNEGKIAIWLKENIDPATDLPTSTNLMVTAGYLVNGSVVATNYECVVVGDANINDGGWHRVTVMAIDNIYKTTPSVPGFVVYIDRDYVASLGDSTKGVDSEQLLDKYYGFNFAKALFPSAVQSGVAKSVIRAVDFDGQGDVDDLVFTATKPYFIEDVECFTVALGEGVASVTLATSDGFKPIPEGTGTFTSDLALMYQAGMSVTIEEIVYEDGYIADEVATNGNVVVLGEDSYLPQEGNTGIEIRAKRLGATVVIGDVTNTYETVALAMADINDVGFSGSATLTLKTDAVDGIVLDNENADIVLDLAGNDVTGVAEEAAITLVNGTLLITNSTEEVGHVVGVPADGEDPDPALALSVEGGFVTVAGGCFDGFVTPDPESVAITGDAKIRIAENDDGELSACVVPAGYTLEEEAGEDPVYYVVVPGQAPTTVRVDFINGELIVATTNVEIGAKLIAPDPEPTKEGHTFRAWVTTGTPADDWDFDEDTVAGAMTLVADFDVNQYAVTFNSNGGSYTPEGQMVDYGDTAEEPTPDPEKSGYTFKFWALQGETTEYDFDTPVTAAITLVAQWEAAEYSITYLYEDGTAFDDWAEGYSVTNTYTVEDVIVLPTADNVDLGDGGEFKGWTNAVGTAIAGWPAGGMSGPVVLYAKIDAVVPPTKHDAGATILCEDSTEAAELAAAITATPAAYVNVPAGVANGAAYCALFRGVADGSKVTIELTADAKTAAQTAVDAAAATIPLSAIASGAIGSQVVIDAVPGLYYSVSVGETCTGLVETTPRVLAQDTGAGANINDGKLAILVGKPSSEATAGFYKVNVNVEPAPQN